MTQAWAWLALAGVSEIVWAVLLKRTDGFSNLPWSAATVAAMGVSFYAMAQAYRDLPMGTVYAVWVGIGAVGVALWGIAVEGEPAHAARIACLLLITAGVAGLKLAG
jgi:quaternary ammonium compound-resistance protein SugE